jgi:DNA-binding HxlR family transcriptional regulator
MALRSYEQYCPIAIALDVLGDRWTLLVIRELLLGPKRFTDLQRALRGISPNLLSDRLRDLEEAGLVAKQELEPPAARVVYRLTDEGRAARDVMGSLARFGTRHLPKPSERQNVRPAMAVHATLTPFLDREAAANVSDHYRLVVDGHSFDLAVTADGVAEADPTTPPDLVLECDAALLVAARQGDANLGEAVADGRLQIAGTRAAFRRFLSVFSLKRSAR